MIQLQFNIWNPFPHKWFVQTDYISLDKKVSANYAWSLQLSKWAKNKIFGIDIDLSWNGRDHAGPELELEILGYFFKIALYRIQHWNSDEHRWFRDDEDPFA